MPRERGQLIEGYGKMKFEAVSGIVLALLFIGILTLTFGIQPVKASATIYIRADGSIDPPTANITTADNITYTFTDNNHDYIVIERSNIVVTGAGYTLQGTGSETGIDLSDRSNVTIKNMEIDGFYYGIHLSQSSNNTVSGNNVTDNEYGIILGGSSNNTVSGNNVTGNEYGIYLSQSSNNTVSGNNVTANTQYGIVLSSSSNNILRDNSMANNGYNFRVSGPSLSHFVNDVDPSNTVNGKPIYYWINMRDAAVPLDAGYVALVNCTSITVQNLDLSKNYQGTVLLYTTNSTITKNNITNNSLGVQFLLSSSNTVSGNNVTANTQYGVVLSSSSNNTISGNNVTDNKYGIVLGESSNNSIYHNNFTNTNQADTYNSVNVWDDGYPSGGNYWSDYTGVDEKSGPNQDQLESDGIGDTPYVIDANNLDRYPLMPPLEDSTPPTTTHDYDGLWHIADFFVNLNATDDLSGVAETHYRINDGPAQNATTHGQPFLTTESANNTLEYWSVDTAGNEEIPHEILTAIKLDKAPPTGYILINNDDAFTSTLNVTLNLQASDVTSGVSHMRFSNNGINWTTWETYTTSKPWNLSIGEGTKTVYAQYKDIAGLVSPVYNDTITVRLDLDPPTTTISLSGVEGNNGWFTSNVTVTLSATDDISGVEKTEYSFDNTTWVFYTAPFNITHEGNTIIYYKSTDKTGNVETAKTETIRIDKTAPSGSIIINNGDAYTTSLSVRLTLTATDDTSGIYQARYSNDNIWDTEPWEEFSTTKDWTLQSGDGARTVYYQIKDNAGLISEAYSDTIILDIAPPTGSIIINGDATYTTTTTVTLTLSATDSTSGISKMRFSNDNITYTEWQAYTTSNPWTLQNGDGEKTVYVQFQDKAGLTSTYIDIIVLDTTQPTGSITIAEDATYTNSTSVTLKLSAHDVTSGVAQMRFSNDNTTWSDWETYNTFKSWILLTGDGTKGVTVQYRDNAGLTSFYSDLIILDTTKPTANAGAGKTVTEDTLVTFDGSASTDENGITSYIWTFTDATPQTLSGKNPTYTFATLGEYTVTLKVTDPAGNSATDQIIITVVDITKPIAKAGIDQTVDEDALVTFDASASSDDVGIISYTWTFTDAGTLQTLDGMNSTYTFHTPGIYTVTLNVTDDAGNHATDTVTITVLDITKPVANAGANRTVNEDTLTTLNASASSDNVGITEYTWTFTDEAIKTLTGEKPTYTFNTPGVYTIALTVTDTAGNWATDTIIITVLDITDPVADAGEDKTSNVGETVAFDAGTSSDNVGIVSYEWDFGDGTTGTGITTTHTYSEPGTYTVTLNVKDAAGNTDTYLITITITPTKPFPLWIIVATTAVLLGIAFATTIILVKKTKTGVTSSTKRVGLLSRAQHPINF